jgi:hypothetical protein
MLLVVLWLILAALSGCTNEGDATMQPSESISIPTAHDTRQAPLPLRLVILCHSDGDGNPRWGSNWAWRVLDAVRTLTGDAIDPLLSIRWEGDDTAYALEQWPLLQIENHPPPWRWRRVGELTVIISNPDTTDSAGVSVVGPGAEAPWFVMRSRAGDAPEDTARILLHEAGHVLGYEHIANPFLGYEDTADTYYLTDAGRARLREWANALITAQGALHADTL